MSQLNKTNQNETRKKWYQKDGWIIFFIIFFFPLGLFLMWRSQWNKIIKLGFTSFFLIVVISGISSNTPKKYSGDNTNSSSSSQSTKEITENQTTASYEIIRRDIYGDPTEETWRNLSAYSRAINTAITEADNPIKSIKIYFKNDGVTIDFERIKKTYSIKDIEGLASALKESTQTTIKQEALDVVISNDTNEETLKRIVENIVSKETSRDSDLDKIFISVWGRKEDIESGYTRAYAVWRPKGNLTARIAKENIRNDYQLFWERLSKRTADDLVTDNDREIYYRYWEIFDTMPTVSFEEIKAQSKKIREIVGEEFGISESEVQSINDKVIKSKPTEYEMKIFDAFEEKTDEMEVQGREEDDARKIIASQFGITPIRVRAIWAHVISWQLE